jgi:hypothetical protein
MKVFGREPTLVLQVISAVLSFLVASGFGLTDTQAALVVAAISAVFGVINAWAVRPIAPAVFTGLVGALAALALGFGFNVSGEFVAGVNGVLLAVLAFLTRAQVTPANDARPLGVVRPD